MAAYTQAGDSPFTVLFVCTGNICRSPIAERTAQAYLDAALGPDAAWLRLGSAGTQAVAGSGVHPHSAGVLTALGGNAGGFVARQLTDPMAVEADLTLALTRGHRRAVLKRAPRGLSRTFTLLEAGDLATAVSVDAVLPGQTFADRCRSLVRAMAAGRAQRASDDRDDIPDPVGQAPAFHEDVGSAIARGVGLLFGRIVDLSSGSRAPVRNLDKPSAFYLTGI